MSDRRHLEICFYVKAESIQTGSEGACLHLRWRHQEESCGSQSEPCFLTSPSPRLLTGLRFFVLSAERERERDALHACWHHHHHNHHLIPSLQHQVNHGLWLVRAAPSLTTPGYAYQAGLPPVSASTCAFTSLLFLSTPHVSKMKNSSLLLIIWKWKQLKRSLSLRGCFNFSPGQQINHDDV